MAINYMNVNLPRVARLLLGPVDRLPFLAKNLRYAKPAVSTS
jgi:hypothetical protein